MIHGSVMGHIKCITLKVTKKDHRTIIHAITDQGEVIDAIGENVRTGEPGSINIPNASNVRVSVVGEKVALKYTTPKDGLHFYWLIPS